MDRLKPISKSSIPAALLRAERYRLLNEPAEAESICLDILDVDPKNRDARIMLILSLSDQFEERIAAYEEAKKIVAELKKEYDKAYYTGLICERRARAHMRRGSHGSAYAAYEWFQRALEAFDKAQELSPAGNEETLFRWNSIIRTLKRNSSLQPEPEDTTPQLLE